MRSFLRIDLTGRYFLFHDGGFEMRALLPLLLLLLVMFVGCQAGYDGENEAIRAAFVEAFLRASVLSEDHEERMLLATKQPAYARAIRRRDNLLHLGPSIRYSSDSLAHADSLTYAYLLSLRISELYYTGDTLEAVFAYLGALQWLRVQKSQAQADEARRFAETTGDAIGVTYSPNMARLSYQAFERAKRLALASEDPTLYHLADSSYKAVARQVMTMPDSVRSAFGPPPDRPARIPWVLATLAAAFIAFGVAGSRGGKRQHLSN